MEESRARTSTVADAPRAPTGDHVRRCHGQATPDPYAWMRDRESSALRNYLRAEREHYERETAGLAALRARLYSEAIGRLPPSAASGLGWTGAEHTYFWRTPEGQDYRQLCRCPVGAGDEVEVVLDENELTGDGGHVRLGVCGVSPDGRLLAYSFDVTGEELYTLRVLEIETGQRLPIEVYRTYDSHAWSSDANALFYLVVDGSHRPYRVRRHVIGTEDAADVDVFAEHDRRFAVRLRTTDSGRWIVVSSASAETSEELLIAADDPFAPPRVVEPRSPGTMYAVEHGVRPDGSPDDRFVITTNDEAPEFRVVGAPVGDPRRSRWTPLVPELPDTRIHGARAHAGWLIVSGLRAATPVVRIHGRDGNLRHEIVPDDEAGHLALEPSASDGESIAVTTASLRSPRRVWRVGLRDFNRTSVSVEVWPGYDPSEYATSRLWAVADDGADVPVTIAHRDGMTLDGSAPCVIRAYGAYERSVELVADPMLPSLLDRGVVYAVAHVRGGGERGRHWWDAGRLTRKWNTFTDLIAVRDHLVSTGWAAADRVVIRGLSAGGMLMAGAYTFWPERFAAAVAEAPAADCLNTMLDPSNPLVVTEYDEWGDPREAEPFLDIQRYTAYEQVTDRSRPPLLVTGILRDPRVVIEEPAKWVAALRAADTYGNRIAFRAELGDMPHAGPTGRLDRLAYEAEVWAFALDACGVRS